MLIHKSLQEHIKKFLRQKKNQETMKIKYGQ